VPSRGLRLAAGHVVGSVDVRELRRRIGIVSAAMEARIPRGPRRGGCPGGATGAIAPWWDSPTRATENRAAEDAAPGRLRRARGPPIRLLSSARSSASRSRAVSCSIRPCCCSTSLPPARPRRREQLAALLARLNADPTPLGHGRGDAPRRGDRLRHDARSRPSIRPRLAAGLSPRRHGAILTRRSACRCA